MQRLFEEWDVQRESVCQQASAANMKVASENEALSRRGLLATTAMFIFQLSATKDCLHHRDIFSQLVELYILGQKMAFLELMHSHRVFCPIDGPQHKRFQFRIIKY